MSWILRRRTLLGKNNIVERNRTICQAVKTVLKDEPKGMTYKQFAISLVYKLSKDYFSDNA